MRTHRRYLLSALRDLVGTFNCSTTQTVPFMAENASNTLTLSVTADPSVQESTVAEFKVVYTAGYYKAEKTFALLIGANIEDWETGGFSSFDWDLGTSNQWQITTSPQSLAASTKAYRPLAS